LLDLLSAVLRQIFSSVKALLREYDLLAERKKKEPIESKVTTKITKREIIFFVVNPSLEGVE
jgi:hypothetical protein